MTEERLEPPETPTQAIKIIKMLIEFGFPKDSSEVPGWLKHVELLQALLSKIWQTDPTGKTTGKCLNYLYNAIATNSKPVSPAVWSILALVEECKISEFVEGILIDSSNNENIKIQNVLTAIIEGLCQCGPYIPNLRDWIPAIVRGLEFRSNYSVLVDVSEKVIVRLMKTLLMPLFRPLTYPVLRQFLYPVMTPTVFYKVLDSVPDVIQCLQKDMDNVETKEICLDFSALIKVLMSRFPPCPQLESKYNAIRTILMSLPDKEFEPETMILWNSKFGERDFEWIRKTDAEKHFESKARSPYKGLMNEGNTCFMNSVLQALYMTTRFRKEMLEKVIDPSERAARDLQQLFAFMQESKRPILTLRGLIESTLPPNFRRGHQQDSSEYLIHLLDTLHENESKIIRSKNSSQNNVETKREGNGDFDEETTSSLNNSDENTLIERLFGGASMSTTTCSTCNKSFPKKDNFRDLHLSVPDNHQSCDLQQLVDESLQSEELNSENMYECGCCGTKRNATRRHVIIKAPQHLILTLKLFRFDPEKKQRLKLHSKLKNSKSIELPVYDSSQLQNILVTYDLKGVVLHSGSSLDGGHYFSIAVDQTGQWFIFNDSVVSPARYEWNSSGGSPYILFLRQSYIDDPPTCPLLSNLQVLVNRDNQKFLAEKKFQQQSYLKKKDYDDDWDDPPPGNGPLGGPGPSLVF